MKNFLDWFGENLILDYDIEIPENCSLEEIIEDIYNTCIANTNALYIGSKRVCNIYRKYIYDFINFTLLKLIPTYRDNKSVSARSFTEKYINYYTHDQFDYYYTKVLSFINDKIDDCLYENEVTYYSNWINYDIINKNIYSRNFYNVSLCELNEFYDFILPRISTSNYVDNSISEMTLESDFSFNYYKFIINCIKDRDLYNGKSSDKLNKILSNLSILFDFPYFSLQKFLILNYLDKNLSEDDFLYHSSILKHIILPYINYYCIIYVNILHYKDTLNHICIDKNISIDRYISIDNDLTEVDEKLFRLINKHIYNNKYSSYSLLKDFYLKQINTSSDDPLYTLKELFLKVLYRYS